MIDKNRNETDSPVPEMAIDETDVKKQGEETNTGIRPGFFTRVFCKVFQVKRPDLLAFFFNYQKKYIPLAIVIGIILFVNVILIQLPMPLIIRHFIDHILPSKDFSQLNLLCLVLLGAIILGLSSGLYMQFLIIKYKSKVHYDLERSLYQHIQELPMKYFARRPSGYILSRIGEISSVEQIMADTVLNALKDFVAMIIVSVLILQLHTKFGLIALIILPFFILSVKIFHKPIKEINKKSSEAYAQYTGKLEKNINSIEKIKSSVKEKKIGQRIADQLSSVIGLRIQSQKINAYASLTAGFVGMAPGFILFWYGGSEIMSDALSVGTFFAISSYITQLYGPARRLTDVGYRISQAMAGIERIYEVFKEKEEVQDGETIDEINEIRLNNVMFAYEKDKLILNNLNIHFKKGERLAIVGESGQGKSTLIKMLLKFYPPDSGEILISGKNINTIAVKSLRKKIAYISQKQRLLEDEFSEKIKDPGVLDLLKKLRLQKDFDSENIHVAEFSGGELQKIELMESILSEADVLIVDEGTSNIDYNSEKIVLTELFEHYKEKITIFIAHRLNSIIDFDRIIVMDNGRIVEEGAHSQLIQNRGKYSFLWGSQGNQD